MNFTSLVFLPFMFLSFSLFYTFKGRLRYFVLFLINSIFALTFVKWNYIVLLIFALYSFFIAFKIKKNSKSIILILLPIILSFIAFKYINVFNNDLYTPIGISFYSFKIISYLLDVYFGRVKPEKDILVFVNYVSFFPTLVSGPITRYKTFMESLTNNKFKYITSRNGAFLLACGIFEKMVIADFIGQIVSSIFNNNNLSGFYMVLGILLYAFQIYVDFDSYSNIAIGASRILGIDCGVNFKTPYLSSNIKEFWQRWHISLSSFFKDYVYIPLGGNKKGKIRQNINTMAVFILSGIWHGSTVNFIIWGFGHGLLSILEGYYFEFYNKLKLPAFIKSINKVIGVIINYVLVSILFVFFRSVEFKEAMSILTRVFKPSVFDYTKLGLVSRQWNYLIVMIVVFIIIELFRYNRQLIVAVEKRNFVIRWAIYIVMIALFVVFAMYGSQYNAADFIYKHF